MNNHPKRSNRQFSWTFGRSQHIHIVALLLSFGIAVLTVAHFHGDHNHSPCEDVAAEWRAGVILAAYAALQRVITRRARLDIDPLRRGTLEVCYA